MNIPAHIERIIGSNADGPNCWNATIHFFEPETPLRFIPGEKAEQWVQENLVEATREHINYILVYRCAKCDALVHTAVNVGPDQFFHKIGCCYIRGYEIDPESEVNRHYLHWNCDFCPSFESAVYIMRYAA